MRYIICLILFIGNTSHVFSQTEENTLYLKVDYFFSSSERIGDYLKVEQELWKPVHQERVNRGIILGWGFYSLFAGEPNAPYNYIAVNVFDDFDKIDYFGLGDIVAEIYPEKDLGLFYQQTRETREVVRTEIWRVDKTLYKESGQLPIGNYITKNFFDARGGSGEHMEMETGFWAGIHKARIDMELIHGWAMYSLYYPSGTAAHYTYSTVDFYERLGDLTAGAGIELARVAYPGQADELLNENFQRTAESRSLFKTEIWKLLDSVGYK
ncbi:MAG: hypothetical protein EA360_04975 [Balneolaceae bacterium]|nr:MAG: hypothetical protein EA360_04975 [Balneolaceae bacterium]